jgi:hypothetical protein
VKFSSFSQYNNQDITHNALTKKKDQERSENGISCFFWPTISQVNSLFKGNNVVSHVVTKAQEII